MLIPLGRIKINILISDQMTGTRTDELLESRFSKNDEFEKYRQSCCCQIVRMISRFSSKIILDVVR